MAVPKVPVELLERERVLVLCQNGGGWTADSGVGDNLVDAGLQAGFRRHIADERGDVAVGSGRSDAATF